MPLVHVPIPPDWLEPTQSVWVPFLRKIARRTGNSVAELTGQVLRGEMELHLAWDPDARRAHALAGTNMFLRNGKRVAAWRWLTGARRERWAHLKADLERYMKEHHGCVAITIDAPPYWVEPLKIDGYRPTHVIMEKDL
jgi:hypothetical protein